MNRRITTVLLSLALILLATGATALAGDFWGDWPQGKDPKDVGKKVVNNLLARPVSTQPEKYPEVCTAYGSFRFVNSIHDKELLDKLLARYDRMLTEEGKGTVRRYPSNVDSSVWGALPLEIYQITGDKRYLPLGLHCADYQWEKPDPSHVREDRREETEAHADEMLKQGLTPQTRFWIDDMFMITGLQVNAYRATKDKKYLDRAAHEMVAYLDKLQQPSGLFFHHATNAPFPWGRGNGWVAVGMTELLLSMPEDHPDRARIMDGYKKMMAALLKYQTPEGMWRQMIDRENFWPESSSTGMFTFAIGNGVKKGWLDADQYKPAARKAWTALCGYMDDDGNMKDVCEGTNTRNDLDYYMNRKRNVGDLHGQAGMIWAAWAMLDEIPGGSD